MVLRTAWLPLVGSTRTLAFRTNQGAHNDLGHKGVFTVQIRLLLRFWWLMLVDNVKWFIWTCYECQICQTCWLHLPHTMPVIGGLFHKVCWLSVYCSSSLCIDRLPWVADVAFQERLCPHFLYFWRYSLSLGCFGRDCHWQRSSLCSGSWCPHQPIQYSTYMYTSPPITPRLMVWLSGVTLMSTHRYRWWKPG